MIEKGLINYGGLMAETGETILFEPTAAFLALEKEDLPPPPPLVRQSGVETVHFPGTKNEFTSHGAPPLPLVRQNALPIPFLK